MLKALRYLGHTYLKTILASGAAIAALAVICTHVVTIELFGSYYAMLPMFFVLFALIYGIYIPSLYRNTALVFGCRRVDFFWACQAAFVLVTLGFAVISLLAGWLPSILPGGYASYEWASDLRASGAPGWFAPAPLAGLALIELALQPIGAAGGNLVAKYKVLGVVLLIVCMLLGVAFTVATLFVMDGTIVLSPAVIWGALGGLVVAAVVCDVLFYRSNRKAVVR